jgi:hypothetical protein
VTFFTLLEDFYPGRLAVKDRDKTHRIAGVILITTLLEEPTDDLDIVIVLALLADGTDFAGSEERVEPEGPT